MISHRIQLYVRNLQPPKKVASPTKGAPAVLGSTIKLVLYCLASRADFNTLECYPSKERIAMDASASIATVKRSLHILEAAGIIVRWPRKRDDGSWDKKTYKLVLTDRLPDGWTISSEKTSENLGGFSENPDRKTKRSETPDAGSVTSLGDRKEVLREGKPSLGEPLTTSEPPYEPPHTQQASVEIHVSEKCYQVADRIRARWTKEALKGPGLEKLPALVAAASQKTGRSPEKVEEAAIAYLKKASTSPRPVTWLGAWFEREEYLPHMPKLSQDERRRGDDATYTAALDRWLGGGEWPEETLGPAPGKLEFWAPFNPIASAIQVAADSPRLRTLVSSLQAGTRYPNVFDQLYRWDDDFKRLKAHGVWGGFDADPRSSDSRYPAYLYERHGVARPGRPALTVVAA